MKKKLLNILLILTSFIGYLEWGADQSTFLIIAENHVIRTLISNPTEAVHPFTLLPLVGQLLLLFNIFQKTPGKWLTYLGICGIGSLLLFMFLIGCISLNLRILFSTLPFLVLAVYTVIEFSRKFT